MLLHMMSRHSLLFPKAHSIAHAELKLKRVIQNAWFYNRFTLSVQRSWLSVISKLINRVFQAENVGCFIKDKLCYHFKVLSAVNKER